MTRLAIVSTLEGAVWGGSEELWAALAAEAVARGIHTTVGVVRGPVVPPRVTSLAEAGVRITYRPPEIRSRVQRLVDRVWRRPLPLARQLRALSADRLVISLSTAYDLASTPEVCQVLRHTCTPYILLVHHNLDNPVKDTWRAASRELFERAVLNCFVAENNLRAVERQTAMRVPNAVLVQNPINLKEYRPVTWPSDDGPRLACVARLDARFKGQDVLFQALSSEAWRVRGWRLSLYGTGPDEGYLRALADLYKITDRVRFCGHTVDIARIWEDEHLLVLPSRSEGTPLALIEAIVAARPAIVTDVGDNARWVEPWVTGFVAAGCSPAAVGDALEAAWSECGRWRAMGEAAHRRFAPTVDRQPARTFLNAVLGAGPDSRDLAGRLPIQTTTLSPVPTASRVISDSDT